MTLSGVLTPYSFSFTLYASSERLPTHFFSILTITVLLDERFFAELCDDYKFSSFNSGRSIESIFDSYCFGRES